MSDITRRAALGALPLALAAPAFAGSAPSAFSDGTIADRFNEWLALSAQIDAPGSEERMGSEAYDAVITRLSEIELSMLELPVNDPTDFVRVVVAVTSRGGFELEAGQGHRLWADADRLIGGAA